MHWQFVLHPSGSWTWRRVAGDGSIEHISPLHEDYGRVVTAAVENGFRPAMHRWTVQTERSITHYAPGRTPIKLDLQGNVIQRPIKRVLNVKAVLSAAPAPNANPPKTQHEPKR
jgi:hypothetical protein